MFNIEINIISIVLYYIRAISSAAERKEKNGERRRETEVGRNRENMGME
jgi:hypothetical protein